MALFRKLRTKLGLRKKKKRPIDITIPSTARIGAWTYGIEGKGVFGCCAKSPLIVGKFCSIATDVNFLCRANHPMQYVSTFPFKVQMTDEDRAMGDLTDVGPLTIGNDVWIGRGATILPNLTIGNGAIIGAESVVTKDVPAYAIVAGNPAKIIRFRFQESQIEALLRIQWWNWPDTKILQEQPYFFSPIEVFIKRHDV